jgi:hypothetical protein
LGAFTDLLPGGDLFLDTRGYKVEVLRGATGLICRSVAMRPELSLVSLYEGAPSITDTRMYTRTHGYELCHLGAELRDERDGQLLQAEGFVVQSFITPNAPRLP